MIRAIRTGRRSGVSTVPAWLLLVGVTLLVSSCDCNEHSSATESGGSTSPQMEGDPVVPPFPVTGNLDGLYLIWFDQDGTHVATDRREIPEEHRQYVRVDSLQLEPSQRLDPEFVYLADVRTLRSEGGYSVRTFSRASFESLIDHGDPALTPTTTDADVIVYGASWCGACQAAAQFFNTQGVPFVEKDIERDPGARQEMTTKANAAGVSVGSIPIIDFRGTILRGFDEHRIRQLIAQGATTI